MSNRGKSVVLGKTIANLSPNVYNTFGVFIAYFYKKQRRIVSAKIGDIINEILIFTISQDGDTKHHNSIIFN